MGLPVSLALPTMGIGKSTIPYLTSSSNISLRYLLFDLEGKFALLPELLDGLTWRSRVTYFGNHRIGYFI